MRIRAWGEWVLVLCTFAAWARPGLGAQSGGMTADNAMTIQGDGVTDNAAALQAMVSSCTSDCTINLVNAVLARRVTLPLNASMTFHGTGVLRCLSATGCFYRQSTTARVAKRVTFSGVHFESSVKDSAIVRDDLKLVSSGNTGMSFLGCSWLLSNSAIGWETSGAYFNVVTGNDFDSPDGSGVAIQPIASGSKVDASEVSTVTGSTFRTLTALKPVVLAGASDAWEGWEFSANHFWVATVTVWRGNAINFVNNQFVNSKFTIDSSFNESISGNYFDTNVAGSVLLTVTHTASPVSMLRIEDNDFEANGTLNVTSVLFAPSTKYETSNVTLTGNIYEGANNVDASGGYGIAFNDPHLRQVYVGAENFRLMYSCIHVTAMLERSTIDRFEARDVAFYGDGFDRYSGPFLRNDFLYKVVAIHLTGYLAAPVKAATTILANDAIMTGMFHSPEVKLRQEAGQVCSSGWSFAYTNTANDSGYFSLIATAGSAVGYGSCDFTAVLDGTGYVPPR